MKKFLQTNKFIFWCVAFCLLFLVGNFILPKIFSISYGEHISVLSEEVIVEKVAEVPLPQASHVARPQMMKALYMTSCVASTGEWKDSLVKLIDTTELNSIIVDIKDYTGMVSYPMEGEEFVPNTNCFVKNMKEFVDLLHQKNIYVIGRVTVFQDSTFTKKHPDLAVKKKDGSVWRDRKGLAFVDVGAEPYWEHMVTLAETAYADGFDEINFDYIRYPSDGDMKNIWFSQSPASTTKVANIERFFSYLRENIPQDKPVISGDLFGMTTTNNDDLNIGQKLEVALKYFDYVYPMVYPSHYPTGWNGFKNPAANPGEVVKLAMQGGVDKAIAASSTPQKLCTWIQDFDLGATYTPAMVRAQIQSTYDVGLNCWLLWDASNKYTSGALLSE